MVTEECQHAASAQQPVCLGDPKKGVAPDRGAVLGHGKVEQVIGPRHLLCVAVNPGDVRPVLSPEAAGSLELALQIVDGGDRDRDPFRAIPAETSPVPEPISMACMPVMSVGSSPTVDSGTFLTPQLGLRAAHHRSPAATQTGVLHPIVGGSPAHVQGVCCLGSDPCLSFRRTLRLTAMGPPNRATELQLWIANRIALHSEAVAGGECRRQPDFH